VIGVKCWVYKGEILPGAQPRGLRNEPEPRRAPRPDRDRDRDRDRRDRPPRPAFVPESAGGAGGVVQQAPGEIARQAILPPMAAPVQPTWKQDSKPEGAESPAAPPAATPDGEKKSE
jgi:small subunit ribosomal protein S3